MEKLTREQDEALGGLLEGMTTEQCIVTMRMAMTAFTCKLAKEITSSAALQYGRLMYPLTNDMARLEAFHDVVTKRNLEAFNDVVAKRNLEEQEDAE